MKSKKRNTILLALLLLSFSATFGTPPYVGAVSVNEIKDRITDRNKKIGELEQEITEYKVQLNAVGEEKQTLESAVRTLDISRKKMATDINLTQNRIGATDLSINELALEIDAKEIKIAENKDTIARTLRTINEVESNSLIETVLAYDNLSDVWDNLSSLERFQVVIKEDIERLDELKVELLTQKQASEEKKSDLTSFKKELSGQKQSLDINRREKNNLLSVTKNKESNYQRILAEKEAARKQFEQELQSLESQLEFALDPSRIPPVGAGVLAWPLNDITITQRFGNTAFANSGAYNGSGHNGVDFRAAPGTPIKVALTGTVVETGNTDLVRGCYSYGKWVLVKHNNGLTTLYAHLSSISASSGQTLFTGDILGYSGNTGYSTGPHLHLSVYSSQGVQVVRLGDVKKITNCGPARIPVAAFGAYLNPLSYL